MNLGPINLQENPNGDFVTPYDDSEMERCVPNEFLDTANRTPVDLPTGVLTYLDYDDGEEQRISTKTKFFETISDKVIFNANDEQILDLNTMYGIDTKKMLEAQIIHEYISAMSLKLYGIYKSLGLKARSKNLDKIQSVMENKLGIDFVHVIKNDSKVSSRLVSKILSCANKVTADSKRRPADFVIVPRKLLDIIKDSPMFYYTGESNKSLIGKVGVLGSLAVFCNYSEKEDLIVVGTATKKHDYNPGVFIGEYKNILRKFSIVDKNFTPRTRIEFIYRCAMMEFGNFPERCYYTLKVKLSSDINPIKRVMLSVLKKSL